MNAFLRSLDVSGSMVSVIILEESKVVKRLQAMRVHGNQFSINRPRELAALKTVGTIPMLRG